jgi:hypothetical protein
MVKYAYCEVLQYTKQWEQTTFKIDIKVGEIPNKQCCIITSFAKDTGMRSLLRL